MSRLNLPRSGVFLPIAREIARNAAYGCTHSLTRMDRTAPRHLAGRARHGFPPKPSCACLFRRPFPVGRHCASSQMPSLFTPRPAFASQGRSIVDDTATKSQQGRNCIFSHWPGQCPCVFRKQWGASNQRGADYEHSGKSSHSVGSFGRVRRTRGIEPNGLRSISADTDHGLIASSGTAGRRIAPNTLTRAQTLLQAGSALLSFPVDERRDDRCSRRS